MSKVVVSILAPVTVLQLTLIHIDHAVPPRCVNVLDLGTKYGECDELLRSGEFTCEHDFCPGCDDAHEGFQAHQCDLSCGYCPEQALPCPTPEESAPCVNRLDLRIEEGQCELLIAAGTASCEHDFCSNCEGSTGVHEGVGQGGHQHGECDRTCGLCPTAAAPSTNCSNEPVFYPRESLPDGYLWETPGASELLADSLVILTNAVGASAILWSAKTDMQPMELAHEEAMQFFLPAHRMHVACILLIAAAVYVGTLVLSEIRDTWVAVYALSVSLSLLWSLKNPYPRKSYYPIGLACPSLQLGLVLVFVGFDYSFGLSLLAISFYLAFFIVAGFTHKWVSAMFFAMQLVFADCLLFWSALFGLQWSLPAQLVLLAAGLRSVGSFSWLVQMRPPTPTSSQSGGRYWFGRKTVLLMVAAPAVLMLVASTHAITHRRVPIGPIDAFLVFGLSLAPMLIWGLNMARKLQDALTGAHHEVDSDEVNLDDAASDTADELAPSPPRTQFRQNRGPPGRGNLPKNNP